MFAVFHKFSCILGAAAVAEGPKLKGPAPWDPATAAAAKLIFCFDSHGMDLREMCPEL